MIKDAVVRARTTKEIRDKANKMAGTKGLTLSGLIHELLSNCVIVYDMCASDERARIELGAVATVVKMGIDRQGGGA